MDFLRDLAITDLNLSFALSFDNDRSSTRTDNEVVLVLQLRIGKPAIAATGGWAIFLMDGNDGDKFFLIFST